MAVYTYACLGRLPPAVGPYKYSFNLLTRSNAYTLAELKGMVGAVNRTTAGLLDLSGLRVGILSACEFLDIVSCLLLGLGAKAVGDDV